MDEPSIVQNFRTSMADNPLPSRRRQGAAQKTIDGYIQDILIFLRWWKQTNGEELSEEVLQKDPFILNRKVLQDFLAWLHTSQGYAAATILRYSASLRAFTFYLQRQALIQHDPTLGLQLPVKKKQAPKGLDDTQRARFESVFQFPWFRKSTIRERSEDQSRGAQLRLARDRAIAYLMLYAGPRVDEVENLDVDDIELRDRSGTMHIRAGKGYKERDVPLPKPAREALRTWLDERAKLTISHNALFVELRAGKDIQYRRLGARSMQNMIEEASQRSGLTGATPPVEVTPHVLRHTTVYMLKSAGVSESSIAEIMGHSLLTTQLYGRPQLKDLQNAISKLDNYATGQTDGQPITRGKSKKRD